MVSPIITLTTDWGCHDCFVGKFKGRMLSMLPEARIIDISHEIEPYNIKQATWVAQNACFEFPEGTIHLIDVDSTESRNTPTIVVQCAGQYFVCADNGLPYAMFEGKEWKAVDVSQVYWDTEFFTFAALDFYTKVVVMLARGADLSEIGKPYECFVSSNQFKYIASPNGIKVFVGNVDNYGNVNLNITYEKFEELRKGRKFELVVRDRKITQIDDCYEVENRDAGQRQKLQLLVSSTGHLQLALYHGSVPQMFSIREESSVDIKFE